MEDLMELVAATFARHGVLCRAADSKFAPNSVRPAPDATVIPGPAAQLAESLLTAVLSDHNYRKGLQGDPAP
jgi:hypothetical protein